MIFDDFFLPFFPPVSPNTPNICPSQLVFYFLFKKYVYISYCNQLLLFICTWDLGYLLIHGLQIRGHR